MGHYMVQSPDWSPIVLLPEVGPNTVIFTEAGIQPHYFNLNEPAVEKLKSSGALVRAIKTLRFRMVTYAKAVTYLKKWQPDIVHINGTRIMLTWGVAAKRLGIPVIWHIRMSNKGRYDRLLAKMADRLIFIAESTKKRLEGIDIRHGTIVYDGIDTKKFYPAADRRAAKQKLGLSPDKLCVGFVGRQISWKRPEWAVQAGIDLHQSGIDAEVVIVGPDQGNYEERLPKMVAEAGVPASSFHFWGLRSDIPDVMRALDIAVVPSNVEPFGLVVIEAMASGAAVIGTNGGGIPEIIDHDINGLLVPVLPYEAFRDAVFTLARSEAIRNRLSAAAQRHVEQKFRPEQTFKEVAVVYRALLKEKGR
jgi:glycosyltransferase involved in cell wall biosynthesis